MNLNWLSPVLVWFLIGTVLIILEFMVPGVILVFFGVSAWVVAALLAVVDVGLAWQICVWIVLSLVLIFTLRGWLSAQFRGFTGQKDDLKKMPSEAAGQRVRVTEDINPHSLTGHVRWKGADWKAEADEPIAEGTMVEIVDQQNLVLKVRKM